MGLLGSARSPTCPIRRIRTIQGGLSLYRASRSSRSSWCGYGLRPAGPQSASRLLRFSPSFPAVVLSNGNSDLCRVSIVTSCAVPFPQLQVPLPATISASKILSHFHSSSVFYLVTQLRTMITRFTFLIVFLLRLHSITCSPIQSLSERQDDRQCGNPAAVFVSSCWTTLGVSNYLRDPVTGWNHTIPVCSDSTKCCLLNEAWTTCYLRLGRGVAGEDCTTMDDSQCKWNGEISSFLDPSIYAQVRYVMKSIYGVHAFFASYFKGKPSCRLTLDTLILLTPTFTALQYAATQAALMITPLTQAIDPQQQTNIGLTSLLFALSLALSFLVVSRPMLKWCISC